MPIVRALLVTALALQTSAAPLAPTGTLRAVFLATNPVQARIDQATGTISGPVPDLIREMGRRLRVEVALMPVPDAATVIDRVRGGQADIGFLAHEAARARLVDFSAPYALMRNAYLVSADSPIRRSGDVDRAGVRVGAVKGQSQQIFVSEQLRAAEVVIYPTMPPNAEVAALLRRGDLQAFAANRQRMQEAAREVPGLRVLDDDFMTIGQAVVVGKGDAARLAAVEAFIDHVLRSGFVDRAIDAAGLRDSVAVAPVRPTQSAAGDQRPARP